MTTLPTQAEMFRNALAGLDQARSSLSDASAWLRSDWVQPGTPLPATAADARTEMFELIGRAKGMIDEAKNYAHQAIEVTR